MASGKVHEEFNTKAGAVILVPVILLSPIVFVVSYGGLLFGTFFLSPDLDLHYSRPSKRWGVINILVWSFYRRFVATTHRSNHTTLGLIIRCLFVFPLWLGLWFISFEVLVWFWMGVLLGDILHRAKDGLIFA